MFAHEMNGLVIDTQTATPPASPVGTWRSAPDAAQVYWRWDGSSFQPPAATTKIRIPDKVTAFQLFAALSLFGELDAANNFVSGSDGLSKMLWSREDEFDRDNPVLAKVAVSLWGADQADPKMDARFIDAEGARV